MEDYVTNDNFTNSDSSQQPFDVLAKALSALGLVRITNSLTTESRPWLIQDLWPDRAIGFIGGLPKSGKSWLSLDLAVSACVGGVFLGHPVSLTGPVLVFLGEDYSGDALARIDQLLAGRGLDRDALQGRLYVSDWAPCLEDKAQRSAILSAVSLVKPVLVIFDPLTRFLDKAEENSVTEMRQVTNWLRQELGRNGEVAVCICHHTDKQGEGLRGTGDLRALSEVTLLITKHKGGAACVDVEMRSARAPDPFTVRLEVKDCGAAWRVVEGLPPSVDLAREAFALLRVKGPEGVSVQLAMTRLHKRSDVAKKALSDAGGVQLTARGKWFLPQYVQDNSSQGPEECADAESSVESEESEERASKDANGKDLDSSQPRDDSGSLPNSFFPPEGVLEEPSGEDWVEGA